VDAVAPFPESHVALSTETCLICHQAAEAVEVVEGEDRPERPLIPHSLEGYDDCLFCHSLDGIKPFPPDEDHLEFEADDCTICHKPEDA
jgi:hypothetical protein